MKTQICNEEEVKTAINPVRQDDSALLKEQIVMYTAEDLMSMFGVCRRTISNWQSSGSLSHFKKGKLVRVTKQQLEEFLQDNTVTGFKMYGRIIR